MHSQRPSAYREEFPDPRPFKKVVKGQICNNLELVVISIIRLTKKHLIVYQRQTSPLAKIYESSLRSPFRHFWCRFLVLWTETNKYTNMYHTSFQSNLTIFNPVQFFGFHHKISNALPTFSNISSATNKFTIISTTSCVFII